MEDPSAVLSSRPVRFGRPDPLFGRVARSNSRHTELATQEGQVQIPASKLRKALRVRSR